MNNDFERRISLGVDTYFFHKREAYDLMGSHGIVSKDFVWDFLVSQYKSDKGLSGLNVDSWGVDGFYECQYFAVIAYEVRNNIEKQLNELV